MRKLKSFAAALMFAALACTFCFAAKSKKIVSNDGKTKIDIVGTWIYKDASSTCTIVFNIFNHKTDCRRHVVVKFESAVMEKSFSVVHIFDVFSASFWAKSEIVLHF